MIEAIGLVIIAFVIGKVIYWAASNSDGVLVLLPIVLFVIVAWMVLGGLGALMVP